MKFGPGKKEFSFLPGPFFMGCFFYGTVLRQTLSGQPVGMASLDFTSSPQRLLAFGENLFLPLDNPYPYRYD